MTGRAAAVVTGRAAAVVTGRAPAAPFPARRRWLASVSALGASGCWTRPAAALADGTPSRTALSTAVQRAAHQLIERPLVFPDPMALRMLGAAQVRSLALNLDRLRSAPSRAMRAFLVARARFAEDALDAAHAQGVRQCVVLGAGLDTFAWRNPHRGLRVFEVDHPATQAWKRDRLRERGIAHPPTLRFVPVDFEKQSLADRRRASGFRPGARTFVSWLGVTMYLTPEAVRGTLRFVANDCAPGSRVGFDFVVPDDLLDAADRAAQQRLAARVAMLGEPWLGRFDPHALAADLRGMGFARADVLDARALNARYFSGRNDGFAVAGAAHLMSAAR